MAYELRSFVSNLVVFCFEECQSDCLFAIQLKLHMIKTANQEFITFNESLMYFYLIDVSYFVYIFLLAKRRSKINMDGTLEVDFEYPDELHYLHNDYPLVPEKLAIPYDILSNYCKKIVDKYGMKVGDVKKLIPNLGNKTY